MSLLKGKKDPPPNLERRSQTDWVIEITSKDFEKSFHVFKSLEAASTFARKVPEKNQNILKIKMYPQVNSNRLLLYWYSGDARFHDLDRRKRKQVSLKELVSNPPS